MPTQIALTHAAFRPVPVGRRLAALRRHGADVALVAVIAAAAAFGIAAMVGAAGTLGAPVTLDALAGFAGL